MNTKSIVTFLAVTIGVLVGAVFLLYTFGNTDSSDAVIADVAGDERHIKGTGPATIVEFSDLQCPSCQAVHAPLQQILAKYEDRVKFVYRHFPLTTIHKNAQISAQATEAAHMQGKFWEMQNVLFAKQRDWEGESDPMGKFVTYAKEIGLDETKFRTDIESQDAKNAVTTDSLAASRYNLSGTPTFFFNGQRVEFADLETKLGELAQ